MNALSVYLKKSAEIPKQYAEIRRNTQAKTPIKNTPIKNPS
jgi:hypothetical protein